MSKIRTAAIGAVIVLGLAGAAGAQTGQSRRDGVGRWNARRGQMGERGHRGMRGRGMGGDQGKFMSGLDLTDAQKSQIEAIHAKYEPQSKALRDEGKTKFNSMRDARQKGDMSAESRANLKQQREDFRKRSMALRQQEHNEIRGVLTADQRTKWDAAQAERKSHMEQRQKRMQERGAQPKKGGK